MHFLALCALALPISTYAAAVALPFQDSALEPVRRSNQCPRIQKRNDECDNESRCCKPGYGCNTSGKGSVGMVCVKRENNYCANDSDCGKDQACITNYVNGALTSFCGLVEPNPLLIQAKRNNDKPAPKPAPKPKCMKTYTVKKGDICAAIVKNVGGLTLADFYRLNPDVHNPSCNNLQIGQKYCVDPGMGPSATGSMGMGPSATGGMGMGPSATPMLMPSQSMMAPGKACMRKVTVKKGDTCLGLIAKAGGLTLADFYRLNPMVNNPSCNNLQIGQQYCVDSGMAPSSSMLAPSSMMMGAPMPPKQTPAPPKKPAARR